VSQSSYTTPSFQDQSPFCEGSTRFSLIESAEALQHTCNPSRQIQFLDLHLIPHPRVLASCTSIAHLTTFSSSRTPPCIHALIPFSGTAWGGFQLSFQYGVHQHEFGMHGLDTKSWHRLVLAFTITLYLFLLIPCWRPLRELSFATFLVLFYSAPCGHYRLSCFGPRLTLPLVFCSLQNVIGAVLS
jgi:hypothetical protein